MHLHQCLDVEQLVGQQLACLWRRLGDAELFSHLPAFIDHALLFVILARQFEHIGIDIVEASYIAVLHPESPEGFYALAQLPHGLLMVAYVAVDPAYLRLYVGASIFMIVVCGKPVDLLALPQTGAGIVFEQHLQLDSEIGHVVVVLPLIVVGEELQCGLFSEEHTVGLALKCPERKPLVDGIALCLPVGPCRAARECQQPKYHQNLFHLLVTI